MFPKYVKKLFANVVTYANRKEHFLNKRKMLGKNIGHQTWHKANNYKIQY